MRQRRFVGEKLFVDYVARTVPIYGAHGEESFRAQLFIGRSERAATHMRRRPAPRRRVQGFAPNPVFICNRASVAGIPMDTASNGLRG